jgi:hypothetical protein
MVHALTEIHRVLHSGGVAADLRPDRFPSARQARPDLPRIYWTLAGRERFQGVLDKAPENLLRHRAATRNLKRAIRRGLFLLERSETFVFRYHFQTLNIFERFLRTAWKESFVRPPVYRRLRTRQRRSPTGHLVVIEPLRLNILRKR